MNLAPGSRHSQHGTLRLRRAVVLCALLAVIAFYGCGSGTNENVVNVEPGPPAPPVAEPQPAANDEIEIVPATGPLSSAQFSHSNQYHSRLPCLICHRRDDNSARLGFPGKVNHLPCAGCHAVQFNDPSSSMCTICHTNPQTGAMKRFGPLRSFGATFNHAKHLNTNCATCHKPSQRGVAKTIPARHSAHVTCFQCHSANSSNAMASCSTCHQPGRLVRTPETARAFRVGFSHAKHSGRRMTCNSCHTVRAGTARGRQVSNPVTAMHFAVSRAQSCASCHNGKRAFGADDFDNCRRCHVSGSFRF